MCRNSQTELGKASLPLRGQWRLTVSTHPMTDEGGIALLPLSNFSRLWDAEHADGRLTVWSVGLQEFVEEIRSEVYG